jgi:hypothetical protein
MWYRWGKCITANLCRIHAKYARGQQPAARGPASRASSQPAARVGAGGSAGGAVYMHCS